MKKIAVIGANSFQNPLILKAKKMGIETHVFAWECQDVGEKTADFFYPVSIVEKEEILEHCRRIGIDAIASIGSDLATLTVSYVADKMHLAGNSYSCACRAVNKYQMRKAFREHGIPTPQFRIAEGTSTADSFSDMKLPLIVKPTDRSGSRCINKITDYAALQEAISQAADCSFEKKAIVEEFIEGTEFSMEGISFHGRHHFLCATRKATTGAPHFIETGHIQPAGLDKSLESRVRDMLSQALDALQVTDGATHSEFMITSQGEVRIVEIGARMGGDCIGSDLVQISTGYDFVRMVVDVAFGKEPSFTPVSRPQNAIIRFIMGEEDLKKLERVKKECPELLHFVSEIDSITSHTISDSSTRYGYYILACDEKEKIGWLLNDAEKYEGFIS